MDERKYVRIPGTGTHELPPLLIRSASEGPDASGVLEAAEELIEAEDMLPDLVGYDDEQRAAQRRFDLAIHLAEQYRGLLAHWAWGDSILEWIRQCEITFGATESLRNLLHPDVWPHAGRSSFVILLEDKHVPTPGVAIEKAVGLRLTFRQPPPIDFFSNQFLFLLNSPIAGMAYQTWAHMNADATGFLPPDRFHFQVLDV